jgi:predicted dehydrogenase
MAEWPVALVGYGYSGRVLHAPLIAATPGLRLAAVVVRRPELPRDPPAPVRALEAVLDDAAIALVVVTAPTADHAELAARALERGKHVVVEKPLAATADEAVALVRLARARGRMLAVFHNRRWDADFLTLQALVRAGRLGPVRHFEARWSRFRPEVRDRWRERPGPGAGIWFDLGSHLADQMLELFGPPAWVQAELAAQRDGSSAADYMHAVFGYASGLRAVLHGSSLAPGPEPRFLVHGEAASWVKWGLDPQEVALQRRHRPGGAGWGLDERPGRLFLADGAEGAGPNLAGDWTAFYAGVREALDRGTDAPVAGEAGAEVVRLLEVAAESAAAGRRLAL